MLTQAEGGDREGDGDVLGAKRAASAVRARAEEAGCSPGRTDKDASLCRMADCHGEAQGIVDWGEEKGDGRRTEAGNEAAVSTGTHIESPSRQTSIDTPIESPGIPSPLEVVHALERQMGAVPGEDSRGGEKGDQDRADGFIVKKEQPDLAKEFQGLLEAMRRHQDQHFATLRVS